jgi:hypothetical protein
MNERVDPDALETAYRDRLEAAVIAALARLSGLSEREAMDAYYRSQLSRQVNQGSFGIQYLSPDYLADDLIENEPELLLRELSGP